MRASNGCLAVIVAIMASSTLADETLYRYEGDVLPYDASAGWDLFNPCQPPCSESLENGHFVLQWPESADFANYSYLIAEPPAPPPTRYGSSGVTAQIIRSSVYSTGATDGSPSDTAVC